jgi:electron transfer flavoprotein alpha subunit
MTAWRIVALAPLDPIDGSAWREAAEAAAAIATAHDTGFDLLLIGADAPSGEGWAALDRLIVARTSDRIETAAQIGAIAAGLLADTPVATLVLVPPGPLGEEVAADLAARGGGRALGRARSIALGEDVRTTRSVFGARAEIALAYPAGLVIAAMRGAVDDSVRPDLSSPDVVDVTVPPSGLTIGRLAIAGRETPLEGAKLVISGGRGLDETGFALLGEIAVAVGGAVGGSLPAVDAGLVPVSRQVGQSGKFVTPDLYLAVGLSGTPQHLAGIGPATRLIAINTDPAAPIFAYAELGAVADARIMLPLLRDALVCAR